LRKCIRHHLQVELKFPYCASLLPEPPRQYAAEPIQNILKPILRFELQITYRRTAHYLSLVCKIPDLIQVILSYLPKWECVTDLFEMDYTETPCRRLRRTQLGHKSTKNIDVIIRESRYPRWIVNYLYLRYGNLVDTILQCTG
jgi:hypothetical protein